MKKLLNRLQALFLNPYVLSGLPAVLLFLIIPVEHKRYVLEQHSLTVMNANEFFVYEDLTGNGYSERIWFRWFPDRARTSFMIVQNESGALYNQWNFPGDFSSFPNGDFHVSGDFNGDGANELFFFTVSGDSLLLNALFDLSDNHLGISQRLITRLGKGRIAPDPTLFLTPLADLDGDGEKELVFAVSSGFSLEPRRVYAYYIRKDSLVVSPESSYRIRGLAMDDLTGNGRPEILITGGATGNVSPEEAVYHDHANWLMVLDHHLEFLFPPSRIPGLYDTFVPFSIRRGEGGRRLVGVKLQGTSGETPMFYEFSPQGDILSQKPIRAPVVSAFASGDHKGRKIIALTLNSHDLALFDEHMNLMKTLPGMGLSTILHADLDKDGRRERIAPSMRNGKLIVFRAGFRQPASIEADWRETNRSVASIKWNGDHRPQISAQLGRNHYLFSYGENPYFYLNFAFYPLTYLAVLLFALLIRRSMRRQLQRETETERKITELQLNMVRNRLDPHFKLNALNAVTHAVRHNQPDKAEHALMQFASLYRHMLLSSGDLRRTLREEIDFTKNYLELERIRFGNRFDYEVSVGPGVNTATPVPKMILQIHAENAVKHGLAPLKQGGRLRIRAEASDEFLILTVADNGMGRAASRQKREKDLGEIHKIFREDPISTGKGLEIMEEFYELYRKYYHIEISARTEDLANEQGASAGTSVTISIRLPHEPPGKRPRKA